MPTTYGNDIVYCLKSHCGVRGYCRQKWVLQVQIICKFSNERTCKRNKDVQGLSCGFEVNKIPFLLFIDAIDLSLLFFFCFCLHLPLRKNQLYIHLIGRYLERVEAKSVASTLLPHQKFE